jgi:hypothetical protein
MANAAAYWETSKTGIDLAGAAERFAPASSGRVTLVGCDPGAQRRPVAAGYREATCGLLRFLAHAEIMFFREGD